MRLKGTERYPERGPNRKLEALRINAGLSPNDLGRMAQVSGKTIRLVEAGHIPTPRIQFAIAEVFGLTPLDIWPLYQRPQVQRAVSA